MKIISLCILVLALVFLWPALVMVVWNAVALALGFPQLTYWLTFGILFLLGVVGNCFRSVKK